MAQLTASRTLVKSSPELWAECSDAASLARHLGAFGEIHITRLEPETAVAWEGEDVRGTVTLEPSGWGTRVVLTAEMPTPAVGVGEPAGDEAATPEAGPEPEPLARRDPVSAAVPDAVAAVEPDPVFARPDPVRADAPESGAAGGPGPGRLTGSTPRLPNASGVACSGACSAVGGDLRTPSRTQSRSPLRRSRSELPASGRRSRPSRSRAPHPASPPRRAPAPSHRGAGPAGPGPADSDSASASAEALVGALDSLGRAHRRPFSHG